MKISILSFFIVDKIICVFVLQSILILFAYLKLMTNTHASSKKIADIPRIVLGAGSSVNFLARMPNCNLIINCKKKITTKPERTSVDGNVEHVILLQIDL